MHVIISTLCIIIGILGGTVLVKEQIKHNRIEFIKAKLNKLGFSLDEIESRESYLSKQNNEKLNEIIKELNSKEKEEIPPVNDDNFFDPLY
ncbi:hypothetical protein, partial [Staphylococcus argensis]